MQSDPSATMAFVLVKLKGEMARVQERGYGSTASYMSAVGSTGYSWMLVLNNKNQLIPFGTNTSSMHSDPNVARARSWLSTTHLIANVGK